MTSTKIYKVLVLDAAQRSALAVVRSLGRIPRIDIITAENSATALASSSRYTGAHAFCPDSSSQPELFIKWLAEFCHTNEIDLVLPITEVTSQLILMNHGILPHVKIPFADYTQVMQLADKGQLMQLAQSLDLKIPRTQWLTTAENLNTSTLSYPLVIKPCLSRIFTQTGWVNTSVKIVSNESELKSHIATTTYLKTNSFMLQEFIPGTGAGIFCLYNHGKPEAFFAHKRLREKPPQGGVSVLSESAHVDPLLRAQAIALLSSVNWHGVAMVEFRMSPEGDAYLMEVNTRFWGSLQLAIDSGVDFPAYLVTRELGLPLPPQNDYRVGQRLRWLLGDLDSLYLYLKSSYSFSQKIIRIGQFFFGNFFHTRHEINRWNDLAPARYELKIYIKQLFGRV